MTEKTREYCYGTALLQALDSLGLAQLDALNQGLPVAHELWRPEEFVGAYVARCNAVMAKDQGDPESYWENVGDTLMELGGRTRFADEAAVAVWAVYFPT